MTFNKMNIIFDELESVDAIYFFMSGKVDIGYEINRKRSFRIRQTDNFYCGGFECCYNRRSQVIYRASSHLSGYFIRRKHLKEVDFQSHEFYVEMRRRFLWSYIKKIRRPINSAKLVDIKKYEERADFITVSTL